jgi:predicted site-specific integrase-resolvase
MVNDNLISANEVTEILGITINNLRQIQHRKNLTWVQKSGRNVFYKREDVEAYLTKRNNRKTGL